MLGAGGAASAPIEERLGSALEGGWSGPRYNRRPRSTCPWACIVTMPSTVRVPKDERPLLAHRRRYPRVVKVRTHGRMGVQYLVPSKSQRRC